MLHMELSKLKLTTADREWLKSQFCMLHVFHSPLVSNTPPCISLLKSTIRRIRWIANNERASEAENDISEIIDNLEVSQHEDDIESDDNSEVEDEFESTDLKVKTFYHATAIWEHYKPWLSTNGARVAYLCYPHPPIIAHSVAHKDPLNNIAVEEFIRMVIQPIEDRQFVEIPMWYWHMVDKFWAERDNFVKQC